MMTNTSALHKTHQCNISGICHVYGNYVTVQCRTEKTVLSDWKMQCNNTIHRKNWFHLLTLLRKQWTTDSRKDQKITLNFDYRLTVLKEREKFKGNSIFFSTFCLNVQNDEHANSTKMHSIEWLELEFSSLIF